MKVATSNIIYDEWMIEWYILLIVAETRGSSIIDENNEVTKTSRSTSINKKKLAYLVAENGGSSIDISEKTGINFTKK